MPQIVFQGHNYYRDDKESVLDSLTRHGVPVPSSCRSGICQSCMMKAVHGQPPEQAQRGLGATQRVQGYFLACVCTPTGDLEVALPDEDVAARAMTRVLGKKPLSRDIMQVLLDCPNGWDYHPGQFIKLHRSDGLIRNYSLASVPQLNEPLELHVHRLPGGQMSEWIHDQLQVGETVEVSAPAGECFYLPGQPHQGLLLIGTGCGLAPLWGIARDALQQGHSGPIEIFHGSREEGGLYLMDEILEMQGRYSNVHYTACVSGPDVPEGCAAGRVEQVALARVLKLAGWRVFLCGHPEMVKLTKRKTFLAGAAMKEIFSDPFMVMTQACALPK